MEGATPQDVLRWAVDEFFPDLTLACSFGGPSGMVLVDMVSQIEPRVEVFYLDTDFLFTETYATRDRVIERYGVNAVGYKSLLTPEEQAASSTAASSGCATLTSAASSARSSRTSARSRASAPWISGLRRDQAATRARDARRPVGREVRAGQDQPARQLDRGRRLGLHLEQRRALQPAPRPELSQRRLHVLHAAGQARRRPPLRPLARLRQDGMRHPPRRTRSPRPR